MRLRRLPIAALLLVVTGSMLARAEQPATVANDRDESAEASETTEPADSDPPEPPVRRMPEVVVNDRADNLVGTADAASEGVVGHRQIESRPLLRPAEVLETVPGMIATQHSGSGKANQYFLRGFNLDHGTDFATFFDGIPLNLPSHGHGQGYTDLNFVIPELVQAIDYMKGPYYASVGDFSSAGAAKIRYFDALPRGIAKLEGGQFGYGRMLVADSPAVGDGRLLYALEGYYSQGPWEEPDDYYKVNGVLRYSSGDIRNGFSVTGLGYYGDWNATDQVPLRAIENGIIDRLGAIDDSDGGDSSRYLLSGEWHREFGPGQLRVLGYGYYYDLSLFSNFTYFLDDPVNGDQFEQMDRRWVFGLVPTYDWIGTLFGRTMDNTVGIQVRSDVIRNGLFSTRERDRIGVTRRDDISETSIGMFYDNKTSWTDWFRTDVGVRVDVFDFDVDSNIPENSGSTAAAIASPKLNLIFGPWYETELYLSGGYDFHSNDARGVVSRIDPKTGEPIAPADPLVRSEGAEIGLRTAIVPNLRSSVSLWYLHLDSELLFIGDAGNTEASRPSQRYGIEFANFYSPLPWLTLDADVSVSRARFRDDDPAGDFIPGSIETVVAAGITVDDYHGFFGTLRVRYFGPRALIEDDSVRSDASTLVNLRAGYRITDRWSIALDVFNLLDSDVSDIDYFYASRLPGEPDDGIEDIHTHPAEPRSFRGVVTYEFGRD